MEAWRGADRVILVDAVSSGSEPGRIHCTDAHREEIPCGIFHASTHSFGVAEAVNMARALGEPPSTLIIYGIETDNFAPGTSFSPAIEVAIGKTVGLVNFACGE